MNDEDTALDFLAELSAQRAAARALLEEMQSLMDRGEAAWQRREAQRAVNRDLEDGSVESLSRLKRQINTMLDELIEQKLAIT